MAEEHTKSPYGYAIKITVNYRHLLTVADCNSTMPTPKRIVKYLDACVRTILNGEPHKLRNAVHESGAHPHKSGGRGRLLKLSHGALRVFVQPVDLIGFGQRGFKDYDCAVIMKPSRAVLNARRQEHRDG